MEREHSTPCTSPPCAEVGPFRYCPIKGCGWMEDAPTPLPDPIEVVRQRLQERFTMAREVLDEQGMDSVAALVPIEEVLIWIDEATGADDSDIVEGSEFDGPHPV